MTKLRITVLLLWLASCSVKSSKPTEENFVARETEGVEIIKENSQLKIVVIPMSRSMRDFSNKIAEIKSNYLTGELMGPITPIETSRKKNKKKKNKNKYVEPLPKLPDLNLRRRPVFGYSGLIITPVNEETNGTSYLQTACGETLTLSVELSYKIAAVNERGLIDCKYKFESEQGSTITVSCPFVLMYDSPNCKQEQLVLKDGSDSENKISICSTNAPEMFETTGNQLKVKYVRNRMRPSGGFDCFIRQKIDTERTEEVPKRGMCSGCGRVLDSYAKIQSRPGAHPWTAAVVVVYTELYDGRLADRCGGVIIKPQHILTVASCFRGHEFMDKVYASVGDYDLSTIWDVRSETYLVVRQVIHPNFYTNYVPEDIAVLVLKKKMSFTSTIQPICLPNFYDEIIGNEFDGPFQWTTGWGSEMYGDDKSPKMQETRVRLVDIDFCAHYYHVTGIHHRVTDNVLCAKANLDRSCQGDLGNPLVGKSISTNQNVVLGLYSKGLRCSEKPYPALYTKVFNYVKWIEDVTRFDTC